ncbi:unnamed protein product [Ceratitis capitata]|uniref:(Mediterranean fruit fly) hypothetical protein n=1 Tax=Ceratitis capitata TaxID=7213 RepID=A0A811UNY9_CERCA|nr:unnamed protein product [Ceratitis capitata]
MQRALNAFICQADAQPPAVSTVRTVRTAQLATQFDCSAQICQFSYATLAVHKRLTMSNSSTKFLRIASRINGPSHILDSRDWRLKACYKFGFGNEHSKCWKVTVDGDSAMVIVSLLVIAP